MRESEAALRVRRAPPPFRRATVQGIERLGPRMVRVTLAGPELVGFPLPEAAASVRLLLPRPDDDSLVIPRWVGNNFLLPDGRRPVMRTFTPQGTDPAAGRMHLDVVGHGAGAASEWAEVAESGWEAAVSGPLKGYVADAEATGFFLAGDETAIPALGQLLAALPETVPVEVHVELVDPGGRLPLPHHPQADVRWHDLPAGAPPGEAMVGAVTSAGIGAGRRVWVAGEAAAVQRIRRHLFESCGFPRSQATIRGYWKNGRAEDA